MDLPTKPMTAYMHRYPGLTYLPKVGERCLGSRVVWGYVRGAMWHFPGLQLLSLALEGGKRTCFLWGSGEFLKGLLGIEGFSFVRVI